jgi:hypothetical protein
MGLVADQMPTLIFFVSGIGFFGKSDLYANKKIMVSYAEAILELRSPISHRSGLSAGLRTDFLAIVDKDTDPGQTEGDFEFWVTEVDTGARKLIRLDYEHGLDYQTCDLAE